jgi:hypothetical protein
MAFVLRNGIKRLSGRKLSNAVRQITSAIESIAVKIRGGDFDSNPPLTEALRPRFSSATPWQSFSNSLLTRRWAGIYESVAKLFGSEILPRDFCRSSPSRLNSM